MAHHWYNASFKMLAIGDPTMLETEAWGAATGGRPLQEPSRSADHYHTVQFRRARIGAGEIPCPAARTHSPSRTLGD